MRTKPAFSLSRKLLRMSWNKYNLYNVATRDKAPNLATKTLFQQKWIAKRETRAYHGDEMTEKQFKRIFNPKLPTVSNMFSTGKDNEHPPVAVLTFAELERRLDFIVFRSNFAPSIAAARQLVIHGKVNLNGKKVRETNINWNYGGNIDSITDVRPFIRCHIHLIAQRMETSFPLSLLPLAPSRESWALS